jgi:hypothetical protein
MHALLALAVIAERRRLRSPAPTTASAARSSSADVTRTHRRHRQAMRERNAFSRARCCVVCSAAPLGRTSATSAAAPAAADTFFKLHRHHIHR